MEKINNSFKIVMNKPNIGIIIFQGIYIAKYHIPKNLNAGSNVDSSVLNAT